MTMKVVGTSIRRRGLLEKLTGEARYVSDLKLPGMLYGKILRSPYPHAQVRSVDVDKVNANSSVHAIITPFDVPNGRVAPDVSILDTVVRFVGDEVLAVAAESEHDASLALEEFDVDYAPLPFVLDPQEALRPNAIKIHPYGNLAGGKPLTLTRGDVDEGFAQADKIFEETFSTPAHSGAALEPRAVLARWDKERLTIWKSSRGIHADKQALALGLDMSPDNVRVVGPVMGAGYGNKDESRLSLIAAILAKRAGRPVKIELTREEEFIAGRSRHGTNTTAKVGVTTEGLITAVHATTRMDTGAYLSSGPGVVRRAGQGALYLYRCANVRYDGFLAYTNKPSAGSYRALGAPQGHFALEVLMDHIAHDIGIDPLEFRLKNHVGPEGQPGERKTPPNQILDTQPVEGGVPFSSNGLRECLIKGAEAIDWHASKDIGVSRSGPVKTGVGMSMFIYRGGPGSESTAVMRLADNGVVELVTGSMDVGQGSATVLTQIAAQELGLRPEEIRLAPSDTDKTPNSPITAGSTVTFSSGHAVREAARLFKARVHETTDKKQSSSSDIAIHRSGIDGFADPKPQITFAELLKLCPSGLEVEVSVNPGSKTHIVNSFGAHFARVEVDTETGQVKVLKYVAAHDSGRILNPVMAVNQVEGGVSQMIGFTLSEELIVDGRLGSTVNASYLEHKSPTIKEYPPVDVIFVETDDPVGPFGAKALGEPPSIGVAPAIVNAIRNAIGITLTDLPITPDRVLNAIHAQDSE